jgi:endonuclease YncB( thermonuclease family)
MRCLASAIANAIILGFCVLFVSVSSFAAGLSGMPEIVDGDTLVVAGTTVRLFGVDAPEMGQSCVIGARRYDCGMVARAALLDLSAGTPITCELIPEAPSNDTEDGAPARCFAAGYDLSEGMAYTGWALAVRDVTDRYVSFEDGAHDAGRGLWKGTFVAPWAWRRGDRLPVN